MNLHRNLVTVYVGGVLCDDLYLGEHLGISVHDVIFYPNQLARFLFMKPLFRLQNPSLHKKKVKQLAQRVRRGETVQRLKTKRRSSKIMQSFT